MRAKSVRLTAYLIELADAWLVPLGCASPRRGRPAGAAATSASAIRKPSGSSARLAAAGIITDYRTPDRFRFGLSPLTTRFTDVWDAAGGRPRPHRRPWLRGTGRRP